GWSRRRGRRVWPQLNWRRGFSASSSRRARRWAAAAVRPTAAGSCGTPSDAPLVREERNPSGVPVRGRLRDVAADPSSAPSAAVRDPRERRDGTSQLLLLLLS